MPTHLKLAETRQWRQKAAELSHDNRKLSKELSELRDLQENIIHAKLEWERTFDAVPDLIAIIDQDYRLERINLALARRLGVEFREALGQPCYKLICGLDEPPPYCPYVKCLANGGKQVVGIEASILGGDFSLTFAPTVDQQGRIKGGIHIFHDIRERKDHEKNIWETRERLRQIISSMPVMLHAHDEQGNLVFWNQECERVTGYSAKEIVGNPEALRLLYPDSRQNRHVNNLQKNQKRGFRNLEAELTSKDGAKRIVSWSNISEQFPIQGWVSWAVGLDVTEKRRFEEKLKESEERYNLATRAAKVGVWDWDLVTGKAYLDPRIWEFIGLSHDQAPLHNINDWLDMAHPDDRQALIEGFKGHLAGDKSEFICQFRLLHQDGSVRWVYARGHAIRDSEGRAVRMLGTGIDITEQKQAEEETKRLEKRLQIAEKMEALGTLASGITHDFNNYLSVILGCLQLAINDIPASHDCLPHLELALKASNNAKDMVCQILSFSRQSKANKSLVRLGALLTEGLNFLRASLPSDIEISSDIPDDPGLVMADSSQIQQMIINLGTNAAHAMNDQGGRLSISLTQVKIRGDDNRNFTDLPPGAYHLITFADNGVGIEPKILERIFEPFFTTKRSGHGTGMGLAVVHGIVKSCGGEITVASQVGHGTTFHIYLPRIDESDKKQEPENPLVKNGSEHILLVDDEKDVLYVISRLLQKLGYRVTSLDSGEKALEMFIANPEKFDLILTDQIMPHLLGTDLVRNALEIRPDIATIIMTGSRDNSITRKDHGLEIEHILLKPFGEDQIAKVIRQALLRG
jgi:PAS domain S-box-containing protein